MKLAHCIECGCHDLAACFDDSTGQPCSWLVVDRNLALGVCSACPEAMKRWNTGDRELAVPIERQHPADASSHERALEAIKNTMAEALCDWMKDSRLTQDQAARKLMLNRPRVSDLQRGRLDRFSIDALHGYLIAAGIRVEIEMATPASTR